MSEKQINPAVKSALELGPVLAFFVAYILLKNREFVIGGTEYDGFVIVTAAFIPLVLVCTFILWRLTGHLSKMQIVTAVLVTVFGGISVWFNDPRFFQIKPTIIYLLFAGILYFGLMRGQSYLQSVMDQAVPLTKDGWMILTRRMVYLFLALAVANEIIWRTQTESTWVYFKTFGITAAMIGFFALQAKLFQDHAPDDPEV